MGGEVIVRKKEIPFEELEQKIIRQIEYYFGNYNLSRDRYLQDEIKKDDGWVLLEKLVRFQRLKRLTEDFNIICGALKKSPTQLMEVSDDCTKIRRKTPPPEKMDREEFESRTLYVKGFRRDTTLDQVLDFFKDYKIESVMMRKRKQGDKQFFKGSIFVTFENKCDYDEFFAKKGVKFDKTELIKETRKDYLKRKDEFFDNLRAEKAKKQEAGEQKKPDFPKGCLLRIAGITENSLTRGDIKKSLEEYGTIAFIEFSPGQTRGVVRFSEGIVSDILSKIEEEDGEKKLQIESEKVTLSLIDGEDEAKYWEKIKNFSSKPRLNQRHFNKGGRFNKKNRNKNQWGKKRNADEDERKAEKDDEPPSKKLKTDANEDKVDTVEKSDEASKSVVSDEASKSVGSGEASKSVGSDDKPEPMD